MTQHTEPTVTQEDREAAADYGRDYGAWSTVSLLQTREGKHDNNPVIQAFARHRTTAEAAAAKRALERAAEPIKRAEEWLRQCSTWLLTTDLDMQCPMETDPLDIADELAALIPETNDG